MTPHGRLGVVGRNPGRFQEHHLIGRRQSDERAGRRDLTDEHAALGVVLKLVDVPLALGRRRSAVEGHGAVPFQRLPQGVDGVLVDGEDDDLVVLPLDQFLVEHLRHGSDLGHGRVAPQGGRGARQALQGGQAALGVHPDVPEGLDGRVLLGHLFGQGPLGQGAVLEPRPHEVVGKNQFVVEGLGLDHHVGKADRGQVFHYFLLFSSQHDRGQKPAQFVQVAPAQDLHAERRFLEPAELSSERPIVVANGLESPQHRVQLARVVRRRRPGQAPHGGGPLDQLPRRLGAFRRPTLGVVALVQDKRVNSRRQFRQHRRQQIPGHHRHAVGDGAVAFGHDRNGTAGQFRKPRKLTEPIDSAHGRADHHHRPGQQIVRPGDGLRGFAQARLVGQKGAGPRRQERGPCLLVREEVHAFYPSVPSLKSSQWSQGLSGTSDGANRHAPQDRSGSGAALGARRSAAMAA